MRKRLQDYLLSALRLLSLLVLATFGTVLLVRAAPGYFTNSDEMDAQHSGLARQEVAAQHEQEGSTWSTVQHFWRGLLRGDLGWSHQYRVPVSTLLRPRLKVTGRLLLAAALPAPLLAMLVAVPCSLTRALGLERALAALTLLGVAVPVSVLAGACLLSSLGGPVAVLLWLLTVRDFRFFSRLLRRQTEAPYLLYARACGVGQIRSLLHAVLRPVRRELLGMVALSFVTALSAVIPVEVIFGVPGAGQMAWTAAMNRDLPVLLVVTLLMATATGIMGLVQRSCMSMEAAV